MAADELHNNANPCRCTVRQLILLLMLLMLLLPLLLLLLMLLLLLPAGCCAKPCGTLHVIGTLGHAAASPQRLNESLPTTTWVAV
jgi:hypothetical protein